MPSTDDILAEIGLTPGKWRYFEVDSAGNFVEIGGSHQLEESSPAHGVARVVSITKTSITF